MAALFFQFPRPSRWLLPRAALIAAAGFGLIARATGQTIVSTSYNTATAGSIANGTWIFQNNATLVSVTPNGVTGSADITFNTTVSATTTQLSAQVANAVSGGTLNFTGTSSLQISAGNVSPNGNGVVSGGTQNFSGASLLKAGVTNSISGGAQNFSGNGAGSVAAVLTASGPRAITGGTQTFNATFAPSTRITDLSDTDLSTFLKSTPHLTVNGAGANAIAGGTQVFQGYSSLQANRSFAIVGGTQNFSGDSHLRASQPNAVAGGTQNFSGNSLLWASATGAVTNVSLNLADNSSVYVAATNALTQGVKINFSGNSVLQLNGFDTTVGAISSSGGAGVIRNSDFILEAGFSAFVMGGTTLTVGNATNSTFDGIIENGSTGSIALTKVGTGTLTLSGANDYSGMTTVVGGKLILDTANNPVLSDATTLILAGGTLQLKGAADESRGQTFGSLTVLSGASTIEVANLGTATIVDLRGSSGEALAYRVGHGTVDFKAVSGTFGTDALVKIFNSNTSGILGAWATVNGGLDWATKGTGDVVVAYTGYTTPTGASPVIVSDPGTNVRINNSSTGNVTITPAATTTINTLNLNDPAARTLEIGTGATLRLGAVGGLLTSGSTKTIGVAGVDGFLSAGGNTANTAGELIVNAGTPTTINSVIIDNGSGAVSLTKTGAGTLTLTGGSTGNNTYSGETTINAGTVSITKLNNLGGPPSSIGFGNVTLDGGTLQYTGVATSSNRVFTVGADGGTIDASGSGALTLSANVLVDGGNTARTLTLTGNLAADNTLSGLLGDRTYFVNDSPFTAPTSLLKSGNGTWVLSGANTYTGTTTVTAGVLKLGASNVLADATGVTLTAPGATLDLNGKTETIGSLSGVTGSLVSLGAGALTIADGNSTVFSGNITGTGSLTKNGTGTLTLSGANTYTGSTTIAAGTLKLASANALSAATAVNLSDDTSVLDLTGISATVGTLAGVADSTIIIGGGSLTTAGNGSTTFSGVLVGAGSFTKGGTGTLTLAGENLFSGSTVISSGTLRLTDSNALAASTLNLMAAGGAVTFSGISSAALGGLTGDKNLALTNTSSGALALNVGANGSTNSYSGVLSGSGSLAKSGTGTLTLTGTNTYTGSTTITQGVLATTLLANGGANSGIGKASNAASSLVLNGGTLRYTGGNASTDRLFTIGTAGATLDASGTGAIVFSNTGNLALSGSNTARTLTLTGSLAQANVLRPNLGNNGTGATSLVKTGAGNWIISGTNTYTGGTTVTAGALILGDGTTNGSILGNITLNGGTFAFNPAANTTIAFGGASSVISGTGSGDLRFDGGNNAATTVISGTHTYVGTTTIGSGTLRLSSTGVLPSATPLSIYSGGTLDLQNNQTFSSLSSANAFGPTDPDAIKLGAGKTLTINQSGSSTFAGAISGSGSFIKSGGGTLTLAGTNTFNGGTTITAGTLKLANTSALAGSTLTYNNPGGFLDFGALTAVTLGGLAGNGDLALVNGSSAPVALTVGANNENTSYDGLLVGGAGSTLNKSGTGTLALGANSPFAGQINVNAGTLKLGTGGTNGGLNANIAVASGATLITNRSDDTAYPGVLSGSGTLQKLGAGTLTITSASPSFTGLANIDAGTVKLLGQFAAGSSTFVNNGGRLLGNGTLGTLTINTGGTIAPGSSVGTLTAGATTFIAGGTYVWEINNGTGTPGTGWDLLSLTAPLTISATGASPFTIDIRSLSGSTAGLTANFDSLSNHSYTILTAPSIVGFDPTAFTILSTGFQNGLNGGGFGITSTGTSLALTFTAVPEPSTYALLLVGSGALAVAGWRRRRAHH